MSSTASQVEIYRSTEVDLTPEEFRAALAEETERRLGMTIDEMVARFDRGDLPDADRVTDLLIAARLLIEPAAA